MPPSRIVRIVRQIVVRDQRRQTLGRLVEDQQARIGQQRAADGQHLLLAARQLAAAMPESRGERGKGRQHAFERPRVAAGGGRAATSRFSRTVRVGKMPRFFGHVRDAEARDAMRRQIGGR